MVETGQILALCCAITWSLSIILYKKSGEHVHTVVINMVKNALGFLLMLPTLFFVEGRWIYPTANMDMAILLLSGVIGIGVADALFLASLKRLGASRSALIDCLYAPSVILLSLIFLDETLSARQFFGGALVVSSILLTSKKTQSETYIASTRAIAVGSILGAISMVFMASGIVLIKPLFTTLPLFWILAVRLLGGFLASVVIFAFLKQKRSLILQIVNARNRLYLYGAMFLGIYISMIFWVAGFKYANASIAAILNQSSTIFTVLFAAVFLGERLTPRKMFATLAAVTGVLLIIL